MTKKTLIITTLLAPGLIVLLLLIFSHDNSGSFSVSNKPKIAATIFPLYDIARQIGGDKIDTILILPPGSSPHTYEASPEQIKNIQGAKYFFIIGAGIDDWAQNISNAVSDTEIVEISKSITLKKNDHEKEFDPHYWLDPSNAKIMAQEITNKLTLLAPSDSEYFKNNLQAFVSRLTEKDSEWQGKMESLTKKDLVVFHDAWGYFANHFGLNIVASFEPFPGKTPSPQYLIDLEKTIKENNIKTLFIEPQLSNTAITTLASDLKVSTDILDPLGGVEQRNSYIDLLDFNVNNVYKALK